MFFTPEHLWTLVFGVATPLVGGFLLGRYALSKCQYSGRTLAIIDLISYAITAIPIVAIIYEQTATLSAADRLSQEINMASKINKTLTTAYRNITRNCEISKEMSLEISIDCSTILNFFDHAINKNIAGLETMDTIDRIILKNVKNDYIKNEMEHYNRTSYEINENLRDLRISQQKSDVQSILQNSRIKALFAFLASLGIGIGISRRFGTISISSSARQ